MQITYIDRKTKELKIENPPAQFFLKFLYHNPFGKYTLLPIVKQKIISEIYGRFMDKSSSVKKIAHFAKQFNIELSELEKKLDEFISFNDFFYRRLKTDARTIEQGFVSPGDGRLIAFENINELKNFYVKGRDFTLEKFLQNKNLANKYSQASLLILRLAPNDYHRFHFPYSGIPSKSTPIKGKYNSVSPHALKNYFTNVFCQNKREYLILKTKDKNDILISPVGATMVGSIIETYTPEKEAQKGDEMGYFKFGGSSIVILVDKDKIKIDADILENTRNKMETFVRLGEKIAE